MSMFDSLEEMVVNVADMIQPRELLSTSEAAAKYRKLNNPGSYTGPWDNDKAPYLTEFMDTLDSLEHRAAILVAPARTGKSDCFLNWLTKTAKCDPVDMMLIHMTQATGRDYSISDIDKLFRHSRDVGKMLLPGRQNDNVHDKRFQNGMRLLIKWPSINELSGKTIPRLWLMDYDRMDDDVAGEGPPFDLAMKRAESFKRFGMCVAESSPGREVEDPKWQPKTPHEAPPVKGGILSLYNRGDRRRRYWRCLNPACQKPFEPCFHLLNYPNSADHMEAAEMVTLRCPHCNFDHEPSMKRELDINGKWIKEGEIWLPDGKVIGNARRTEYASFWLKGPAAIFQSWKSLVYNYLVAHEEYESTGNEGPLKKTINTDQGLPYTPQSVKEQRLPEMLKERAAKPETWRCEEDRPTIPAWVRYITATIDVQKSAFVVQVHGFSPGRDCTIIDMFKIRKSARIDDDGDPHLVDPAGYPEDWKLLIQQVIQKTYPLDDDSGRHMAIKMTGCDSGGREGVTANAYNFWRYLRREHPQLADRFLLLKGEPSKSAPRFAVSFPDSKQKDAHAIARGDVPVGFINSNAMKDQCSAMLNRSEPGGGMVIYPHWAPDFLYAQLTAEIRTAKGWENPRRYRNEAWDLLYYAVALNLHTSIRIERINWDAPPAWAAEWDENDFVFMPVVEGAAMPVIKKKAPTLAELSKMLT